MNDMTGMTRDSDHMIALISDVCLQRCSRVCVDDLRRLGMVTTASRETILHLHLQGSVPSRRAIKVKPGFFITKR